MTFYKLLLLQFSTIGEVKVQGVQDFQFPTMFFFYCCFETFCTLFTPSFCKLLIKHTKVMTTNVVFQQYSL